MLTLKASPPRPRVLVDDAPWPTVLLSACLVAFGALGLGHAVAGCTVPGPVWSALPGVVSAVEAVTAAARAQGRDVAPDILAEAKAVDAAHEAAEKARDKRVAAILAAVRRKPVACVPVGSAVVPVVAAPIVDAGTEAGR